jgi:transposase-like protein
MAKRASQTRDARTTDRTSARRLGTEVNICGKRRRWKAEQKRQIVAEGMEPGMSAAMVARKHGTSTGQFYAWRQRLVLRGALDAGGGSVSNVAGIDATVHAGPGAAICCPAGAEHPHNGSDTGAARATGRPDRCAVATRQLREDFGAEHPLTTNRTSVPNSPRAARADCGQADRSGATAPGSARPRALRRFRHGDRVDPSAPGYNLPYQETGETGCTGERPRRQLCRVDESERRSPFQFASNVHPLPSSPQCHGIEETSHFCSLAILRLIGIPGKSPVCAIALVRSYRRQ